MLHRAGVPLAKAPRWTSSWSCQGTPRVSWKWVECPCPTQFPLLMSESAESPECSRSFQSPCEPRPKLSPLARPPQYSGPWPSCFPRHFGLREKWKQVNDIWTQTKFIQIKVIILIWRNNGMSTEALNLNLVTCQLNLCARRQLKRQKWKQNTIWSFGLLFK